ncbi:Claudin-1 [Chelonia mydas]|uniref:Claudin n=1 Tax=Chelonia mydas TaxID=8469 RepID=M7BKC1_CHEMY|nr:Claudin-1 [Chelonia mydas]
MSSYAGDNIVTAQAIYEGLWMSCVMQSTGQMQCKVYDSLLKLEGSLQATRALMVAGILLGLIAIFVAVTGMKCMKCMEDDEVKKMRMAVFGGVIFLIAGFAVLVATSWYGHRVAQDFYNPFTPVNTSTVGYKRQNNESRERLFQYSNNATQKLFAFDVHFCDAYNLAAANYF